MLHANEPNDVALHLWDIATGQLGIHVHTRVHSMRKTFVSLGLIVHGFWDCLALLLACL